jgi:hypothetical protein
VRPHVLQAVHGHKPSRIVPGASADARDQRVPRDQALELAACLLWDGRLVRATHDRRERPVDVEHDRSSIRGFGEGVES